MKTSMHSRSPRRQLEQIKRRHDSTCPVCRGARTVGGSGNHRSPVLVLGEAPGRKEEEYGTPFVGAAGKLLRSSLWDAGLNPAKVYLTNAIKSMIPSPSLSEAEECYHHSLEQELELLDPTWTLALGRVAFQVATHSDTSITQSRGKVYPARREGLLVFPTFHPAYILRQRGGAKEALFRDDLKTFAAFASLDL